VDLPVGYIGASTGATAPLWATAERALPRLRFTGDVRAVPEGRVVFAGEPLLEVTAGGA
jgi:hypothetical protein